MFQQEFTVNRERKRKKQGREESRKEKRKRERVKERKEERKKEKKEKEERGKITVLVICNIPVFELLYPAQLYEVIKDYWVRLSSKHLE